MEKSSVKEFSSVFLVLFITVSPLLVAVSGDISVNLGETGLPIKPSFFSPVSNASAEKVLQFMDVEDGFVRVLVSYRKGLRFPGYVKVEKVYHLVPFVLAKVPFEKVEELSRLGFEVHFDIKFETEWLKVWERGNNSFKVNGVYPFIGTYPAFLNETADLMGVSKLWEMGLTGKGVVVAVLDTGINKRHPSLDDLDDDETTPDPKVIGEVSFVEGEDTEDLNGHGTYVASIIAGTGYAGSRGFISTFFDEFENASISPGTQKGMAPEAYLLNVKVLSGDGYGYESWVISGIEWAVDHGADVISMSLGGPVLEPLSPLNEAVRKAVEEGVVVVVAAGNGGPGYFSISNPGNTPEAITVGAVYETGNLTWFSSRGPTPVTLNVKPDVLGCGVEIIGANNFFEKEDTFYISGWGTSPATALVSGSVALLLQAYPGASPEAIKISLMKTARDLGLDANCQGSGIVNVSAAYEYMAASSKVLNEVKPVDVEFKPEKYRLLNGLNVSFIGEVDEFSLFEEYVVDSGALVNSSTELPVNLSGYDVLVICKPSEQNLSQLHEFGGEFLSKGGGILLIGDNLTKSYENFTGRFGIHWNQIGLAVGGVSSNLVSHWVTDEVSKLFFGGPLTSLRVSGDAKVVAYDPVYPAVAIWENSTSKGRIVVLSDDDVLNNDYLSCEDNLRFGLNSIAWVGKLADRKIHEVSVGLTAPKYVYNGSTATLTVEVANFGDYSEEVPVRLEVRDLNGSLYFNWSSSLSIPAGEKMKEEVEVSFSQLDVLKEYVINVSASISDFDPRNNVLNASVNVLAKNPRAGYNPVVSMIHPSGIDSFTPPLVSTFPGDFKLVNLTFISSVPVSAPVAVIEGNVSELSSFSSQLKLTNEKMVLDEHGGFLGFEPVPVTFNHGTRYFAGLRTKFNGGEMYFFKPIQVIIPKHASIGRYLGHIYFLNGSVKLAGCDLSVSVRKPLGKLLFDDVFDYLDPDYNASFDAERLWGGVDYIDVMPSLFDWWVAVSREGYELDSLAQLMRDESINDPWSVFLSGRYSSIVIFDKDMHRYEMSVWPKILARGVSLLTIFDGGFDGLFLMHHPTLFPETVIGMGTVQPINGNHPLMRNFTETAFLGGYGLLVSNESEAIATGIDLSHGSSLSGAVLAVYKNDKQTKQVGFGDSNIFEYLGGEDVIWLILYYRYGVDARNFTTKQLALNLVRYVSNKPPSASVSVSREVVEQSGEITVDIVVDKPVVGNLSICDGKLNFVSRLLTNISLDPGLNSLIIRVPGNLTLGEYFLRLDVIDEMWDTAEALVKFRVSDLTPPSVEIIKPDNGSILSGLVELKFSCVDRNLEKAFLRLDGSILSVVEGEGEYYFPVNTAVFTDGLHILTLNARDSEGNVATDLREVVFDNNPPSLSVLSPVNGQDFDEGRIWVSWDASDAGSGLKEFLVRVDSGKWVTLGLNKSTHVSVEEGPHTILVKAVDNAGYSSVRSVYFTVGKTLSEKRFRSGLEDWFRSTVSWLSQIRSTIAFAFTLMGLALILNLLLIWWLGRGGKS